MPPFKRLPKSQVAATEQGLAPMTQFFKPKIKPGRPSRTSSKAGRKAAPKDPAAAPAAKLPAAAAAAASAEQPKAKKQKVSRQNWSKGDGLKRMTEAVAKWELEAAKPEKGRMSVHLFAEVNGIPYTTFQTHITSVDGKRIKLGSSVGKKPLLDSQSKDIIVDVLVRKDRVNRGVGVTGALDLLEEMHPDLTRKQLDQAFRRTVRPAFSGRLTKPVVAQATTTKRTAITVFQQWRWHKVISWRTMRVPPCQCSLLVRPARSKSRSNTFSFVRSVSLVYTPSWRLSTRRSWAAAAAASAPHSEN